MDEDDLLVQQCFISLIPGGVIHIHFFTVRDTDDEYELGQKLATGALITSAALLGQRKVFARAG